MNDYNKLKLAVYESSLDWDEKNEVINIMESCDENEFQDICESVELFLEKVDEAKKRALKEAIKDNRDWIGLSLGSVTATGATLAEINMFKKELKKEEARLEKFKELYARCKNKYDKKYYKDQISQGEKSVSNLKKSISRLKIIAAGSAVLTTGSTAISAYRTKKDYDFNKNHRDPEDPYYRIRN